MYVSVGIQSALYFICGGVATLTLKGKEDKLVLRLYGDTVKHIGILNCK